MRYERPLIPATFLERSKRFSVLARIGAHADASEVWCHCPNPGRLTSCLDWAGTPLFLSPIPLNPKKPEGLRYRTEQSMPEPGVRVGINPNRANSLALEELGGPRHFLRGWEYVGSEIAYGSGSRIDHLFTIESGRLCYVEVKSVTYREGTRALFPDAVSERALRHLSEMLDQIRKGHRALLFFVVQRADCQSVAPAEEVHPAYGKALREAFSQGLEIQAGLFSPDDAGIDFLREIPVEL